MATSKFEPFAKSVGKDPKNVTLADLKKQKKFVMHGGYIKPFTPPSKSRKKASIPKKPVAVAGKAAAKTKPVKPVTGLFSSPQHPTRRSGKDAAGQSPNKKANTGKGKGKST